MYVVVIDHRSKEAMADLLKALTTKFPGERFTVEGSEEKGYKLRIEGAGDEKPPRAFAKVFLKTWKPNMTAEELITTKLPTIKVSVPNIDDMLGDILPGSLPKSVFPKKKKI